MIDFEITRVDEPSKTVQIKYSKEGKPDYFVRANILGEMSEAAILAAADENVNVMQAVAFWDRVTDAPIELSTTTGQVRERIIEPPPTYDKATQKIQRQIVETDEAITETYVISDITTDEMASFIRQKRNNLLQQSDNEVLADRNPSDAMITYRQALRDITDQAEFPLNVSWPIRPID